MARVGAQHSRCASQRPISFTLSLCIAHKINSQCTLGERHERCAGIDMPADGARAAAHSGWRRVAWRARTLLESTKYADS